MWFAVNSLWGIFYSLLPQLAIILILQFIVCKYILKGGWILPLLTLGYLAFKEYQYFSMMGSFISVNANYFVYGLMLILPYGSFVMLTTVIYLVFYIKVKKNNELKRMKIMDL